MDEQNIIDKTGEIVEEEKQKSQENPELQSMKQEQAKETDYFAEQQEKIQKTKEKLKALLEKIRENPGKETIGKKLLRIRIERLRAKLNRSMEKFDIEYRVDQEENEKYEVFKTECDDIQEKIETLEDKEDELLNAIEIYMRSENYRRKIKEQAYSEIKSLAPRGQKQTDKRDVKAKPKENKSTALKKELATVRKEIEKLREELTNKIEDYKDYKEDLAESVKSNIDTRMNELREEEKTRKKQKKEEKALTNPSLWTKIRGNIKKAVARVSAWNKKRQEAKVERSMQCDKSVSQEAETTLARKTAREQFIESNRINPILQEYNEVTKEAGEHVKKVMSEGKEPGED